MPPKIPDCFSKRLPNIEPIFTPMQENKKAMKPISKTAIIIFTSNAAKVTPTAKASMLVATAAGNITFTDKEAMTFPAPRFR